MRTLLAALLLALSCCAHQPARQAETCPTSEDAYAELRAWLGDANTRLVSRFWANGPREGETPQCDGQSLAFLSAMSEDFDRHQHVLEYWTSRAPAERWRALPDLYRQFADLMSGYRDFCTKYGPH